MPAFLGDPKGAAGAGWNEDERRLLQARIVARQPFIDFGFSRVNPDGPTQSFRVSGEPMFDDAERFTGYSGIGVEVNGQRG